MNCMGNSGKHQWQEKHGTIAERGIDQVEFFAIESWFDHILIFISKFLVSDTTLNLSR